MLETTNIELAKSFLASAVSQLVLNKCFNYILLSEIFETYFEVAI
jgi:hypothetical protein